MTSNLLQTDAGFILLSIVLAWLVSGVAKSLLSLSQKKGNFFLEFARSGGMPSQHSAFIASVATAVLLVEGFSTLFFLSVVVAIIIMYDAAHVRLQVGEQAKLLQELAKKAKVKTDLKIVKGHTAQEVLVGAALGILSTGIVFILI